MYSITEEGENSWKKILIMMRLLKRMEQFQNIDFEQLKASREQLHEVFQGFMKASQRALQDEEMKKEFDQFVEETKERLKKFSE